MKKVLTASQTIGPYYLNGLPEIPILATDDIPGDRISITGTVFDGGGEIVSDTMIEIWQANSRGKYDHPEDDQDRQTTPGFKGFGRVFVDGEAKFDLQTIKPGAVAWMDSGNQAPHINVSVFARGVLRRMATRIYFADEPANAEDPVLNLIKDEARRSTLLAQPVPDKAGSYTWDIILQGDGETVFFEI